MPPSPRTVDLRAIPPEERNAAVTRLFDALEEGDSLLLVSDRDPRAFYHLLRAERPDTFAWEPVEDGPPEWRISLARLPPLRFEKRVGAFLDRDQREILLLTSFLLADLRSTSRAPSLGALAIRIRDVEVRLETHFRREEAVLFPELCRRDEAFARSRSGPLLADHEALRAAVHAATASLERRDANPERLASTRRAVEKTLALLKAHANREEEVYLSLVERSFDPEKAANLVARFRLIR